MPDHGLLQQPQPLLLVSRQGRGRQSSRRPSLQCSRSRRNNRLSSSSSSSSSRRRTRPQQLLMVPWGRRAAAAMQAPPHQQQHQPRQARTSHQNGLAFQKGEGRQQAGRRSQASAFSNCHRVPLTRAFRCLHAAPAHGGFGTMVILRTARIAAKQARHTGYAMPLTCLRCNRVLLTAVHRLAVSCSVEYSLETLKGGTLLEQRPLTAKDHFRYAQ